MIGRVRDPDGVLTYAYRGCVFEIPEGLAAPKKGSLFFCRISIMLMAVFSHCVG